MIGEGATGIRHAASHVRDGIAARADDPAAAAELRLVAQQFDMIAEDFERAADNLVRDRAELDAFFASALPHLDGGLVEAVVAARAEEVADLRVSTLMARADRDMRVFISVHARIDEAAAEGLPWAVALGDAAWAFIDGYLERRRYRTIP